MCTAAKQKNSGQNLEEDMGQNEQKTDLSSTEKILMEEKLKLEEQLKETVVRLHGSVGKQVSQASGDLFQPCWPGSFLHCHQRPSQMSSPL